MITKELIEKTFEKFSDGKLTEEAKEMTNKLAAAIEGSPSLCAFVQDMLKSGNKRGSAPIEICFAVFLGGVTYGYELCQDEKTN